MQNGNLCLSRLIARSIFIVLSETSCDSNDDAFFIFYFDRTRQGKPYSRCARFQRHPTPYPATKIRACGVARDAIIDEAPTKSKGRVSRINR